MRTPWRRTICRGGNDDGGGSARCAWASCRGRDHDTSCALAAVHLIVHIPRSLISDIEGLQTFLLMPIEVRMVS